MGKFFTLLRVLLKIENRLMILAGLVQLLLEHQQNLQPVSISPTWLDNQDVMQKLKISESTLKRHRLKGVIRSTRIGGKYYYNDADIQVLLREGMI